MFKESDTLTAGDAFQVFDTEFGKMGENICFDIRWELPFLSARRTDLYRLEEVSIG